MRMNNLLAAVSLAGLLIPGLPRFAVAETVPSLPDLLITADKLTMNKTSPKGGDKVTFKAVVRNVGTATATNVKVTLHHDSTPFCTKTVSLIAKTSGSAAVSCVYQLPDNYSGLFVFEATAEIAGQELEQGSNWAARNFQILKAERDFLVESIKVSPQKPKVGQQATFTIKVKNAGNASAKNVKLKFFAANDSSQPTATITIPTLGARAATTKTAKWTIPADISPAVGYTVRATADPDNAFDETNEANNTKAFSFNLTAPNLKLSPSANTYTRGNLYKGVRLAQWAKVTNDNVLPIPGAKIALYYYLGTNPAAAVKLAEQQIGALGKKAAVDVYIEGVLPDTIPLGTTVHVLLKLDPANTVVETDETDNVLEAVRTLIEKPRTVQYPYLRVNVVGDDGNPLNGATVKLTNTVTGAVETKTTGSETFYSSTGNVIFESRPDTANYRIEVAAPGYRGYAETMAYDRYSDAASDRTIYLDKKALVTGKVTNQNGAVLPGVMVRLEGTGLEAVTDSQGKYGFLLNGGTYDFRYVKSGYARLSDPGRSIAPLSTVTLDKTMSPATVGYLSGTVTDDSGNPLQNVDIWVNGNLIRTSGPQGQFDFQSSPGAKTIKIKKTRYVTVEFQQTVLAGEEYPITLTMYKPSTDNHVERGATFVAWHQHEGTPANAFFIPEYNVDVWWGIGNVKMGLDYTKSDNTTKLTKLVVTMKGDKWDCHKVEGEGEIETSAIDIPLTIAAGGCSSQQTQVDVRRIAIESDGVEVWSDEGNWSSASDPQNANTKVFSLPNVPVAWNGNFKVKVWFRVQKKGVIGTDGDGSGALAGYHLDKKLVTWFPQKPPTTKISTSWGQIGGYFLGILDNPVNIVAGFTDIFTVEQFNQYALEDNPVGFPD